MLPQTITSWLYPEFVQSLVDGDFYQTKCPSCKTLIKVEDKEIMLNSPKGIILIPNGPKEKLKKILYKLEVVDKSGIPFTSKELSDKLQYNMKHLNKNPILKKQHDSNNALKNSDIYRSNNGENKRIKRFKIF